LSFIRVTKAAEQAGRAAHHCFTELLYGAALIAAALMNDYIEDVYE